MLIVYAAHSLDRSSEPVFFALREARFHAEDAEFYRQRVAQLTSADNPPVSVTWIKGKGKSVVANRAIAAGEVIFVRVPLALLF